MKIEITKEMEAAMDIVELSGQHLYITGKAGTGKTTLLRHMIKNIDKSFIIGSPTGIAAINSGGSTLHSLFGIPFGPLDKGAADRSKFTEEKAELFKKIDVLVIDEVSMVRPDMLDFIDAKLRIYRQCHEAFGGVQLVMFGDLFQLPPVVKAEDKKILAEWYSGFNFFDAHVFKQVEFDVVELTHIFRQSDPEFIRLLNNMREYKLNNSDLDALSELRDKNGSNIYDSKYIHVCTHKRDVERINTHMLGDFTETYFASISGDFNIKNAPCDQILKLRIGARVMVLINNYKLGVCNGSLGDVVELSPDLIKVRLDTGAIVPLERYKWVNEEYKVVDGKVKAEEKGSCSQFPLTLAWAITIHKSQGLTFDNVAIHTDGVFAPGQIYVALSRCRTLDGIITDTFINRKHIKSDEAILRFHETFKRNGYTYKNTAP